MNLRHRLPLLLGSFVLSLALGLAMWRQANPSWKLYQPDGQIHTLIPAISNKPELCLTCHEGIEEISKSHPTDVFGCVACHGGDPLSLDQSGSHRGLYRNPADLAVAGQSCGTAQCHGGDLDSNRNHLARTRLSLHTTYSGAITSVLQSQGVTGLYGINAIHATNYGISGTIDSLLAFDPSTQPAFAQNCLACHLAAPPEYSTRFYRGSGCAACHTPYNAEGRYTGGDPTIPKNEPGHPARHTLTVIMPYTQCTACHTRGDYSTQFLTFIPREAATLIEARDTEYQPHRDPAAVKCERELDCIDCHNASETMGDGQLYPNLAASPRVECRTCHGTLADPPSLVTLSDPNHPAFRRDLLNDNYTLREGDTVVQSPNGDVLGAVRWQDNRLVLTSRITGQTFFVRPVQGSTCQQDPQLQEAYYCRECHAANP